MERIYCDLMLLASGVIAALAVAIICVKIPSRPEFGKLKTARATLAASFITLSILNFICYFTGYDESLDRLNTLIVAAFQALLLTGTLLVFIRPDVVTGKWVGLQTAVVCILSALLYCIMFIFRTFIRYSSISELHFWSCNSPSTASDFQIAENDYQRPEQLLC